MTDLIADYEQHLRRQRRAGVTIDDYLKVLRRMDRELPAGLACATTDELEAWIFAGKSRGGGQRSDNTLLHYVVIVQGFTAWATDPKDPRLDYDAAADLPTIKAEAEHPTRAATPEEVAAAFAGTDEIGRDLFTLAAFGGFRCVEIHRGRREHIARDETRIYGKGGKLRRVPTHPALWERFKDRPEGPLAYGKGAPLTREQVISWGSHRLCKFGLSMHSLRKFFGTEVYEASDRDILVAQDLLGHKYVTTTQIYIAVNQDRRTSAVMALQAP